MFTVLTQYNRAAAFKLDVVQASLKPQDINGHVGKEGTSLQLRRKIITLNYSQHFQKQYFIIKIQVL